VSGRKYSAIFSMMVCRMESRSNEEVRALATSWKMANSWLCRLRSASMTLVTKHQPRGTSGNPKIICVVGNRRVGTLVTE
jgi:hypothetical protein